MSSSPSGGAVASGASPSADGPPARGRLVLAATPIGDVADAPRRLVDLLATADLVAAEDTRRLRRLVTALGVSPAGRVISYHEHNEAERAAELVAAVRRGETVLLVTDAGTPSVSDPGLRAVRAVSAEGLPVTAVPGPSAALTALALSGLAVDRFCFEGFLPRRPGERRRALAGLAREPRTMVFFEAPHRLERTLAAMAEAFGESRPAAVCRELTKTHEQVLRRPLGDLLTWARDTASSGGVRGEITLVVAGCPPTPTTADAPAVAALVAEVLARVEQGERIAVAAREVASAAGAARGEVYAAAVAARRAGQAPASGISRTVGHDGTIR